jgi:two-component system, LytTR family, response regulator
MDQIRALRVVVAGNGSALHEDFVGVLRQQPGVDILGKTSSVGETRSFLASHEVDIIVAELDVPGGGAFVLAGSLPPEKGTSIIFTANDDARAVDAFRYQPLDFLVHPVKPEHLKETLNRAWDHSFLRRLEDGDRSVRDMLQRARHGVQSALRLMVKTAGRISFVRTEDIDWVEAERDYVRIHNAGKKHLLRQKISHLEQQLPPGRFLRIHRSTIVNIDRIKELQPLSFGEYSVILQDGTRLTMSRSFRERVFEKLQSAA